MQQDFKGGLFLVHEFKHQNVCSSSNITLHAKAELCSHFAEILCNPQHVTHLGCLLNFTKVREIR